MYLSLCVYSIKDCLHETLITVINAYMYHLYMLFRSVRPIALYMAQISCQMKPGRHVASFWGKKGGIFYKILTSRKKVTSQNYKNSNLWRGKKQVGTYMYCTYNFYFNFFKYRRGLLASPPPPQSECYVPVWCPAFFLYRIVSFVSYTPYVDMAVLQLSRLFVLSASSICMLFIRV